jgi:hypothetical protein
MDSRLTQLDDRAGFEKWDLYERGELRVPLSLSPCSMQILIVVDGPISFNHAPFGLTAVLDTLRANGDFFVKFDVTKAHRQADWYKPDPGTDPYYMYTPDYEGFRFSGPGKPDGFDLNGYDQIWFFGFYVRNHPDALSDAELEVISRWMDRGGSVLAAGDHEELGAALCSRIPRVRSMRKWFDPSIPAVKDHVTGVPPVGGLFRHDTLTPGHDSIVTFDDESDDIPQTIVPRYYGLGAVGLRSRPHPLLCGKDGVIDILPDHPHEGEVVDDADINLDDTYTFGSYAGVAEYPAYGGVRPTPEVIAWGDVHARQWADDANKGAVNAKRFGLIGAYDGHAAGIGRVVVDSTFHHWFDVNLTGRHPYELDSYPTDWSNPKTRGFGATPAGKLAYARIQNYFTNVAIWLGPRNQQKCMLTRATWGITQRYPAIERLSPRLPIPHLGEVAIDALGRRASQCTVSLWIRDFFIGREVQAQLEPGPEPCLTCPTVETLEKYIVGGMTRQLLTLAYDLETRTEEADEEALERRVREGMKVGLDEGWNEFVADYGRSVEMNRERLSALSVITPEMRLDDDDVTARSSAS